MSTSSSVKAASPRASRRCARERLLATRVEGAGSPVSDELSFEAAQRELEAIVERLERGQAGLDEAIALSERGEELYRFCLARLDAAHGKIEQLARRAPAP
jgi:exodeoxyribonuclease VII small subunit